MDDHDNFSECPLNVQEIIYNLNPGKVSGVDCVTRERIRYAGDILPEILYIVFKRVFTLEHILVYFRRGIQGLPALLLQECIASQLETYKKSFHHIPRCCQSFQ